MSSTDINSALLSVRCDELLDRLADGALTPQEQTEAAPLLADRIRRLKNACDAGFAGKLMTGKWRWDEKEFDDYDGYLAHRQSDR